MRRFWQTNYFFACLVVYKLWYNKNEKIVKFLKKGENMTNLHEIYKCTVCGNIVEVVHASAGELVCCGKPMHKMVAGETDGAAEKHVPVLEKMEGGYRVKVGSVPHPATEEHHIEWIEIICNTCNQVQRAYIKPGEPAQAEFKTCSDDVTAREYCN